MASEAEVLEGISQGEGQHREFKRVIDNLESMAGEIVAFANSDGGILFIGVEDNSEIVGLSDPDTVFQSLSQICRDRCIPPVSPVIETFSVDGKPIVVLTVNPTFNGLKPYRTAGGRFYIRIGRDKRDATGRELVRIAQASGELHYDESPVVEAGLDDFSLNAFNAYHQVQFGLTLEEQLSQIPLPWTISIWVFMLKETVSLQRF